MGKDDRRSADEIKEILREALDEFKQELVTELKVELLSIEKPPDDPLVRTSEICLRWGRRRTTVSRLIKEKKLIPVGKYGHSFYFQDL